MSKFQLALLIIFGLCIVGGVMAFSIYKGNGAKTTDLIVWGTISTETWNNWYSDSPVSQNRLYKFNYVFVPEESFDNELVNAIAEGRGPDMIIAFHDKILKNQSKLTVIPFSSFSMRDFQNNFVDGANVLITPKGELGVPVLVDPMVLYYNKDIFTNFSLVNPPDLWEQIYILSKSMTVRDEKTGNIIKSTIPLGSSNNVLHFKDILSTMITQAGGAIISDITPQPGSNKYLTSVLGSSFDLPYSPANAALLYFTEFSNPAKVFYTWNRSMPDSLTEFSSGDSAMFIGLSSDYKKIKEKNPNLNFDVYYLPQSSGAKKAITFGRFLSLAVPKNTPKTSASFGAIFELMTTKSVQVLSDLTLLPPARRDLLKILPQDPYQTIFYSSAIQSMAWKDPNTKDTDKIFQNMIDSVTSGKTRVEEAVSRAQNEMQSLINSSF